MGGGDGQYPPICRSAKIYVVILLCKRAMQPHILMKFSSTHHRSKRQTSLLFDRTKNFDSSDLFCHPKFFQHFVVKLQEHMPVNLRGVASTQSCERLHLYTVRDSDATLPELICCYVSTERSRP